MYRQIERESGAGGAPSLGTATSAHSVEFLESLPEASRGIPRPTTPLFDREPELEYLCALLTRHDVRLVTVTGPGGVGKTRLAQEAANRVDSDFSDGVIAISLAPIRDAAHVLPAIARATGVRCTDPDTAANQLIARLHEQRMLIVLDNCEQVLESAPGIAQLLGGCPHLTILATSRVPLRLATEHLVQTTPLSIDASSRTTDGSLPGAMQLFISRAQRVDAHFSLDARNADAIREICRRLDGLPLAIELAAARIRAVSPHELLERLQPGLPLLALGPRDLPERQQTMRAAIAWSYDLLSEREQQVFRWLSVFVGGFRLPAAEAVISSLGAAQGQHTLTNAQVVESIDTLIASSLLRKISTSEPDSRYAMLEVVREFGIELLEAQDELTLAMRAHAAWYASIREWLDPNRYTPGQQFIEHLWAIDAEHPNIRAALVRSASLGDTLQILEIAGNTAVFWHHRGFLGEGRSWLEQGLLATPDAPPETRAWGLAGLGLIRWSQGDAAGADPWLREAHMLAEQLEHLELRALSLHLLALATLDLGRIDEARDQIETALALWQHLELRSDEGMALIILSGIPPRPGEIDQQRDYAIRALRVFESIGHPSGVGLARSLLGHFAQLAGDERRAFDYWASAVSHFLSVDERWLIARPLFSLAELGWHHERFHETARLLGIVDDRLQRSDARMTMNVRDRYQRVRSSLSEQLGAAALNTVMRSGSQLSDPEIESLIADLGARMFEPSLLTRREIDVLQRIAGGATDREIADALFVSPRTIHTHVSHILTKLDAPSRRKAVQRAQDLGLIDLG